MNISPLQLDFYFITELHLLVNKEFKPDSKPQMREEDLSVSPEAILNPQDKSKWKVSLKIKHQIAMAINSPYSFAMELVGFFSVRPNFPEDCVERLVKTNGTSMLYGVAREMIREVTSKGPYFPVLLPSVSFYEPLKAQAKEPVASTGQQPSEDAIANTQ